MTLKIKIIRRLKSLFIKCKFYVPGLLLYLCYLSELSKWVNQNKPLKFKSKTELYNYLIDYEKLDNIDYFEFGVAQGESFKWWLENIRNEYACFVGFDTFYGLPERFGIFDKGAMSTNGKIPVLDDARCEFVKGLFQETLSEYLDNWIHLNRKVIHLDADIYSSTLFVLTTIAPYLKKGDILIFDEFSVPLHEFKAYMDFIKSYYVETEIIGIANNYLQVAFKVKGN